MNETQDHLIVTKGPRTGEKIQLTKLPIVIGREESTDVPINLQSISRKHARISKGDAGYLLEDLNSSNGTFVNEIRLDQPSPFKDGDLIALGGDFEMRAVIPVIQMGDATAFIPSPHGIAEPKADAHATAFMGKPAPGSNETIAFQQMPAMPVIPPRLVINEAGKEPRIITLSQDRLRIGRQEDNEIFLDNRFVSRRHAELERRGQDYYIIPSSNVSNPLLLDGQPVMSATRLQNGDKIRVGGYAPGEMVTIDYLSPASEGDQTIKFTENRTITIGREQGNTIVLPAPAVSRYHAEIEKVGQRYRVRDLRSSNGTFVNGQPITGETWVQPGDAIQIGSYRFVVADGELSQSDQSEGVSVEVIGLNKWVSKTLNILQDISLHFNPKEFVVVVGQSGGGKSTLVDAISGYRPATHGRIVINKTIDVYKEFDAIRSTIGYVPQKDIIHMELTVFQALNYAAQLRMPADTTETERLKRVEEVMEDLDLKHRKDIQISRLSGGQQKRVSIGVELLTKPGLFFLDEPTSGLDPGMETELMHLMRRLADQGRTIVMITHATKNVMLADKVVFLARGGYLAWFGPPDEALTYFDKYRTERDRRAGPMEFDHIYTLLDNDELGSAPDWADRFRKDAAYQKYITEPLSGESKASKTNTGRKSNALAQRNQVSTFRQFLILSARNITILTRDKFSLVLLLLTAPLMASLDYIVASGMGRDSYGWQDGNFNDVITSLIVLSNTTMLVGGLAFMRELVKERDIYKRERMINLKLSSYIMSKIWVALALAVYQTIIYVVIRYTAFEMPGGAQELLFISFTTYLLIFGGMLLGLFASAIAPNGNSAPLLLVMFIIPQMVLSGALVPLPAPLRAPAESSWALQNVIFVSGAGSDIAQDACWDKTKEERDDMTLDEKNEQCTCMGENALRENSCNFPGLGEYYDEAIDTADPVEPAEPGPQPEEPVMPDEPTPPEEPTLTNPNSLQAMQLYLSELETYNAEVKQLQDDYNAEVTRLQDDYKAEIDEWQQENDDYRDAIETYQKDLTDLEVKRAIAIGAAESSIERYKDDFGWTFINKEDKKVYYPGLLKTWLAQIVIIGVLFGATVYVQKRRDVV